MSLMGRCNQAPVAGILVVQDLLEMPFVNRRSPVQSWSPDPVFQALRTCAVSLELAGVIMVLRR
jgi:hypothetical protein